MASNRSFKPNQRNQNRGQTTRQFAGEIFESVKFLNRETNGNALKCKPTFWNHVVKALLDGDWSFFGKWTNQMINTDAISAVLPDKPYTIKFYGDKFIIGQQIEMTFEERTKELEKGTAYDDLIFIPGTTKEIKYDLGDLRVCNMLELCFTFMQRFFQLALSMPCSEYDAQLAYVDIVGVELISYLACKYVKLTVQEHPEQKTNKHFQNFIKSMSKYVFLNFNNLAFRYTSMHFDEDQMNVISALDEGLFQHDQYNKIMGVVSIGKRLLMKRGIDSVRVIFRAPRTINIPDRALYITFDQEDMCSGSTVDEVTTAPTTSQPSKKTKPRP